MHSDQCVRYFLRRRSRQSCLSNFTRHSAQRKIERKRDKGGEREKEKDKPLMTMTNFFNPFVSHAPHCVFSSPPYLAEVKRRLILFVFFLSFFCVFFFFISFFTRWGKPLIRIKVLRTLAQAKKTGKREKVEEEAKRKTPPHHGSDPASVAKVL
jgi:hypothetical protein